MANESYEEYYEGPDPLQVASFAILLAVISLVVSVWFSLFGSVSKAKLADVANYAENASIASVADSISESAIDDLLSKIKPKLDKYFSDKFVDEREFSTTKDDIISRITNLEKKFKENASGTYSKISSIEKTLSDIKNRVNSGNLTIKYTSDSFDKNPIEIKYEDYCVKVFPNRIELCKGDTCYKINIKKVDDKLVLSLNDKIKFFLNNNTFVVDGEIMEKNTYAVTSERNLKVILSEKVSIDKGQCESFDTPQISDESKILVFLTPKEDNSTCYWKISSNKLNVCVNSTKYSQITCSVLVVSKE